MTRRALTVACVLLAVWLARTSLRTPLVAPDPGPLSKFPAVIGEWTGRDSYIDPAIVKATGADAYLNRLYRSSDGELVSLYVGYYRSQREGDQVHSPLNCLPGAGWQPLTTERVPLAGAANGATINRVIVDKSDERQLVLYWYQSLSRVTASEYWSKAYMVADAFRSGRSDIALIRVVMPLGRGPAPVQAADDDPALDFAGQLVPLVTRQLFHPQSSPTNRYQS